ncbi:hypothetical protein SAMN05216326_12538 [Nitrosomonas marina]|uniref:Uncharacterized protein n=1 Tax=Nitrosomonas marina TaxID=917 RepID=A0A1I0E7I4_9PROT|nr:hypothetical protein [Nitrosomonas marina]SET40808.1 hypothetical protein SAMN05216326_12538 [Nitrosomonas marina]
MARARNIKPSFLTNEQLADNDPLGRLLFIGLWMYADYNGNLEYRERTLKVQILPFDNCDFRALMINLDKSGLIRFYSDSEKVFVNIPNFNKHQSPHKNERDKPSEIPEYTEDHLYLIDFNTLTINPEKSGVKRECSTSDRAESLFLNPSSLNPESPLPDSGTDTPDSNESSVSFFPQGGEKPPPPATKKNQEPITRETWEAYSVAYESRYGTKPVRNATVSSQLAQFVKRIGKDESPRVAEFFVHHNNQFYVTKMHTVGLLLADAEKLRTEWATKRTVTQTQARQMDRTQARGSVFNNLISEVKASASK